MALTLGLCCVGVRGRKAVGGLIKVKKVKAIVHYDLILKMFFDYYVPVKIKLIIVFKFIGN